MPELILIAHNIRSTHNVGSIFRTAEGFGVAMLHLTGYTPYPTLPTDNRLPHLRAKITKQISKTALGAEKLVRFAYHEDPVLLLQEYTRQGFTIAALEQTPSAVMLPDYTPPERLVVLLGEEVHGITPKLLEFCEVALEIPMRGRKESFNVSVATGIALYALNYNAK